MKEEEIVLFFLILETVHLSVQLFHQGDISRCGLDPKVFFGSWVKGKAIPHLLALRVRAVETINLCAWEKITNKFKSKMAVEMEWRPLWLTHGRRRPPSHFHPSCQQVAAAAGERIRERTSPPPPNICSSLRDYLTSWTRARWLPEEAILLISCSVCASEVRLTDGRVLREAEQRQVPVAAVRPVVIEIRSEVCSCCGRFIVLCNSHYSQST